MANDRRLTMGLRAVAGVVRYVEGSLTAMKANPPRSIIAHLFEFVTSCRKFNLGVLTRVAVGWLERVEMGLFGVEFGWNGGRLAEKNLIFGRESGLDKLKAGG